MMWPSGTIWQARHDVIEASEIASGARRHQPTLLIYRSIPPAHPASPSRSPMGARRDPCRSYVTQAMPRMKERHRGILEGWPLPCPPQPAGARIPAIPGIDQTNRAHRSCRQTSGGPEQTTTARADRHSEDAVPKMVDFRDPARSVMTAHKHRKRGMTPFAGRQG